MPAGLLAECEDAVKSNDQGRAAAAIQIYGEKGHPVEGVFETLIKYTISEDGRLHGEKFFHTVGEEYRTTRPAFRWRQITALARVTASAYGYDRQDKHGPRPGLRRSLPPAEGDGIGSGRRTEQAPRAIHKSVGNALRGIPCAANEVLIHAATGTFSTQSREKLAEGRKEGNNPHFGRGGMVSRLYSDRLNSVLMIGHDGFNLRSFVYGQMRYTVVRRPASPCMPYSVTELETKHSRDLT